MPRVSFTDLLQRLDQAVNFCQSLGLEATTGRFGLYRRHITFLVKAVGQPPDADARARLEASTPEERHEWLVALSESLELATITALLERYELPGVREKLRFALKGPSLPEKERPGSGSNQARDFLFELDMAAKLSQAGFHPALGERPDLSCDVDGTTLFFECKRPSSPKRVDERLKEARKQLRTGLRQALPGKYGVIAMSLSKIYQPGDKLLIGPREEDLRNGLARDLGGLAESTRPTWALWNGKDVVGILFHIVTVAVSRDEDRVFLGQQLTACPLADPRKAGGKAFLRLGQALQALAH